MTKKFNSHSEWFADITAQHKTGPLGTALATSSSINWEVWNSGGNCLLWMHENDDRTLMGLLSICDDYDGHPDVAFDAMGLGLTLEQAETTPWLVSLVYADGRDYEAGFDGETLPHDEITGLTAAAAWIMDKLATIKVPASTVA